MKQVFFLAGALLLGVSCSKTKTEDVARKAFVVNIPPSINDSQKVNFLISVEAALLQPSRNVSAAKVKAANAFMSASSNTEQNQRDYFKMINVNYDKFVTVHNALLAVVQNHRIVNRLSEQDNYDYFMQSLTGRAHNPRIQHRDGDPLGGQSDEDKAKSQYKDCTLRAYLTFTIASIGCIGAGATPLAALVIPCTAAIVGIFAEDMKACEIAYREAMDGAAMHHAYPYIMGPLQPVSNDPASDTFPRFYVPDNWESLIKTVN